MKTIIWRNGRGTADGVTLFSSRKDVGHNTVLPFTVHCTLPGVLPFYAATEEEVHEKSSKTLSDFLDRFSK